jgi:hypothetical protein
VAGLRSRTPTTARASRAANPCRSWIETVGARSCARPAHAPRSVGTFWEPSTTGRAGGIGDDRRSEESMVMKRHRVLIRRPALERAQPQSYISTCRSGLLELKARKGSQKCVRTVRSPTLSRARRDGAVQLGPSPGGDRMARDGGIITRISRPDLQFLYPSPPVTRHARCVTGGSASRHTSRLRV